MPFTRTPGGLAETWRFHQVPTIWVEGPTDIFFYEPIIRDIPCRLQPMHGSPNAHALIQALVLHDYPYLVILDGDYTILGSPRAPHRSVIRLARYSYENYFWEKDAANRACLRHARSGDNNDIIATELDRVAEHLREKLLYAVVLDVAARQTPNPPAVLPKNMEQLFVDNSRPEVDPIKIAAFIAPAVAHVPTSEVQIAQAKVDAFLRERCFIHLLKGHLVMGVLRRVFIRAAAQESGTNSTIAVDALAQILAEMMWHLCRCDDHHRLKRKIRNKTRMLLVRYPAAVPAPVTN